MDKNIYELISPEIRGLILHNFHDELEKIKSSIGAKTPNMHSETVKLLIHRLNGTSKTFGAKKLGAIAQELEIKLNNDTKIHEEEWKDLHTEIDRVKKFISLNFIK